MNAHPVRDFALAVAASLVILLIAASIGVGRPA